MRRKSKGMSDSSSSDKPMMGNRAPRVASVDKVANTQSKAQAGLMLTGSDPGTNYGETPMSVGNITRSFTTVAPNENDRVTTPSAMLYGMFPVSGFIEGWSASVDTESNTDTGAALMNSSGRDDVLYPVTQHAKTFDENVWPVIENILSSGVGSRAPVSESAFVRHQSRVLKVYTHVLATKWLNYMTYHYDWSTVFPYTNDAPAWLYKLCIAHRCDDIEFVRYWIPILKRIETRTVFPDMVVWIKRMMTPMMSSTLTGRVMIPIHFINFLASETDTLLDELQADLTYLDVVLSREDSVLRSFIPFTLAGSNPWETMGVGFDLNRHTAFWNSGKTSRPTFAAGDSSADRVNGRLDLTIIQVGDPISNGYEGQFVYSYASRYPQVKWDELRLSTLMGMGINGNLQNFSRLITLARHGYIYFLGDGVFDEGPTGDYLLWDGIQTDADDPVPFWFLFRRFFESKHMDNKALYGTRDPDYIYSHIPGSTVARLIHLETEQLWMFQMLRFLTTATAGNALRDMRSSIADLIVAKNNPPST